MTKQGNYNIAQQSIFLDNYASVNHWYLAGVKSWSRLRQEGFGVQDGVTVGKLLR